MNLREILKSSVLLYAEDEPIVRDQLLATFRRLFKEVKTAPDGETAYRMFREGGVHMIVTDIAMPKMNGLEMVGKIRESDSKIPIIVTTSHETNEYLKEAVRLYLVDYLVKPFSLDALKSVLEKGAAVLLEEGRVTWRFGEGLEYDFLRRKLSDGGRAVALSLKEQRFLELMIRNRNRVVTREMVEYEVWDGEEMSEAALKNLLLRLRKKVGKTTIQTVNETGFLLRKGML